jgi:hypothetical protein
MKLGTIPSSSQRLRKILRLLVILSFADLGVLLLILFAHALTYSDALLFPTAVLASALAALSIGSLATGVAYSWEAYPAHRRPIIFIVLLTLATLLAHLYIIGKPQAGAQASVSGQADAQFHDDRVSVSSVANGQKLTVTVTVSGGDAIASVQLNGTGLIQATGFNPAPSYASPLQPGTSLTGIWTLTTSNPQLTLTYQHLTCYSTGSKAYGCIMDEVFYVPEAQGILSGQHCSPTGTNCHLEHPVLVPELIAAGMAVFGQFNAVGWRIAPVLLGTFSLPLVFGIAWKVSGDKRLAYFSATLLALDVMFFSQSSGGLLDVPETFFGLAAFFAYFAGVKVWKFDKFVVSGALLGVAGLAKETAIFIALGFLSYVVIFGEGNRGVRIYSALKVAVAVALVFSVGLQAYDSTLGSPAFPTFAQHVGYVLSYGSSLIADKLACQPTTGYWCKFPSNPGGPPILPTDWILYYSPVAYYATSVSVCPNSVNGVCQGGQYSYVALAYYGVTNLLVTWTVFVWVPMVAYALYRQARKPQPKLEEFGFEAKDSPASELSNEVKFASLALVYFLWSYLPYIFLFVAGRVTYPFYFVPAIPAVAMGASYWLTRSWFPRSLLWVYLGMAFVFFFVYFPDKSFLPDWLRVIIGH